MSWLTELLESTLMDFAVKNAVLWDVELCGCVCCIVMSLLSLKDLCKKLATAKIISKM
jgi:hypothetical protein